MTTSRQQLRAAVRTAPFNGSQRALCIAAGVDRAQFNRVLNGGQEPTPRVVGLVAKVLPKQVSHALVDCYLKEVADEIAQAQRPRLRKAQ